MSQSAACFSLLLLALLAVLHLGRSWVEEGIDKQFYSLSATDATGHNVAMSTYVGKVVSKFVLSVCLCLFHDYAFSCVNKDYQIC